ncbi:hypothetical protein IG631_19424 [Alternaria alternata]|nr:hypothetical protein IG631_19424 [Alternaria alternata]
MPRHNGRVNAIDVGSKTPDSTEFGPFRRRRRARVDPQLPSIERSLRPCHASPLAARSLVRLWDVSCDRAETR